MRFLLQILVITILASMLELFLPWWSIAIAAALGGYFFTTRLNFLAGFISIAFLWALTSLIIDLSSGSDLTERVATIFSLTRPLLILVTALIGALVAGFAAMAGGALRQSQAQN